MNERESLPCPKCRPGTPRGKSGPIGDKQKCRLCGKGMSVKRGPVFVREYYDCDWHYWMSHWPRCPTKKGKT